MKFFLDSFHTVYLLLIVLVIDDSEQYSVNNTTFLENDAIVIDFKQLCEEGTPILQENNQLKLCYPYTTSNEYKCPNKFWCHIGTTNSTNYCCPETSNLCELHLTEGYGTSMLRRFYYDSNSASCKDFLYKGYGGNQNNYLSKTDCEQICQGYAKSTGISPSALFSGIHSEGHRTTIQENIFTKISSSQSNLVSPTIVPIQRATATAFLPNNYCELAPDKGYPQEGTQPSSRWYFDVSADRCIQFYYLGSNGNANNFLSEELCRQICNSSE
ncbi:unnamed protein product [Dracunculus medinensis]|uniref:BPTI/Kunitz inhibitor domain-containing protein n=1 Tax=Dracunculus medinensis TaxID=318479 RepID=A0A0N4U0R6_DRAME|nr:unnamed protein product [Dracunculus medinensis]